MEEPWLAFVIEWVSHVLVGASAAVLGVLGHRAWSRRRWRRAPAGLVNEAVLAVDLVNSTGLASRHGDALAMRARNLLERRALAAARRCGVTFVENTGDGCMMTFASVGEAARAAEKLLNGLVKRPPDLSPGPPLEVRGEERVDPIPDRNRVFLDEDAAHELAAPAGRLRQVGVCRLAGFSGFHRVFELRWRGCG